MHFHSSLMSHQIVFGPLGGHLQLALYDMQYLLMPPFSLPAALILFAGNFCKSTLHSLMVLDTKSSSFKKNQNISLCKILAVYGGYLARDTCAYTALYQSSTDLLPGHKLVSRSNLALTSFSCGLQKIFILGPYHIQAKIFCRQAPGNILIHPKISTPCYDFLALLWHR